MELSLSFVAKSGKEAVHYLKQENPDILFLDIDLGDMNSLQIFDEVEINSYVIFVTGFNQYAVKAFEKNAVDYILKPVEKERVRVSLERVLRFNSLKQNVSYKKVLDDYQKSKKDFIFVKNEDEYIKIKLSDVLYFEAYEKKVSVVTIEGRFTYSSSLQELEEILNDNFAKIHKSYIVNIEKIDKLKKWFGGGYLLEMINGDELKISRNFQESFFEKIGFQKH